jgi:arylsulfatase A-like enzyme
MLVRYPPRVPAGVRVKAAVGIADIPATLLKLAGIDDNRFPGFSLDTLWRDSTASRNSAVLLEHAPGRLSGPESKRFIRGLVTDSLHYIRYLSGREELFRTAADPWQRHDLAADSAFGARLSVLREELLRRSPDRR